MARCHQASIAHLVATVAPLLREPEHTTNLEARCDCIAPQQSSSFWKKYVVDTLWKEYVSNRQFWKDYAIDVTASWMFWTPAMASVELLAGMTSEEITGLRKAGIVAQAIIMRPYEKIRERIADYWKVTNENPLWQRIGVELATMFLVSIPTYTAMLYSAEITFKKSVFASLLNPAASLLLAMPYGFINEKWARLWGRKPVMYE